MHSSHNKHLYTILNIKMLPYQTLGGSLDIYAMQKSGSIQAGKSK